MNTSSSALWMHGAARRFVSCLSAIACATRSPCRNWNRCILPEEAGGQALKILHIGGQGAFSLAIVSNTLPADLFRLQIGLAARAKAAALTRGPWQLLLCSGYYTHWEIFASKKSHYIGHGNPASKRQRQAAMASCNDQRHGKAAKSYSYRRVSG